MLEVMAFFKLSTRYVSVFVGTAIFGFAPFYLLMKVPSSNQNMGKDIGGAIQAAGGRTPM